MPYAPKGGRRKEKVVDHDDPLPSKAKHVAREARYRIGLVLIYPSIILIKHQHLMLDSCSLHTPTEL